MSIVPSPPQLPPKQLQRPIEDSLLSYLGSFSPRSRLTAQKRLRVADGRTRGSRVGIRLTHQSKEYL